MTSNVQWVNEQTHGAKIHANDLVHFPTTECESMRCITMAETDIHILQMLDSILMETCIHIIIIFSWVQFVSQHIESSWWCKLILSLCFPPLRRHVAGYICMETCANGVPM